MQDKERVYSTLYGSGTVQGFKPGPYRVVFDKNSLALIIPQKQLSQYVRVIPTGSEREQLINSVNTLNAAVIPQQWKVRYLQYQEQLQSKDIEQVISVYKAIKSQLVSSPITFGERKMLQHTQNIIQQVLNINLGE